KMAVGARHSRRQPRHRIIAMEHAYHGDMFGAMAVGHRGVFSAAYRNMLFEVWFIPFPAPGSEQRTLDRLESSLRTHRHSFPAAAHFFTAPPTPGTRSPAPPPWPISIFGKRNRFRHASAGLPVIMRARWPHSRAVRKSAKYGKQVQLPLSN